MNREPELDIILDNIIVGHDGKYSLFDMITAYKLGRDHAWHLERNEEVRNGKTVDEVLIAMCEQDKPLSETNPYLKDPEMAKALVHRSVVTSRGVKGIQLESSFKRPKLSEEQVTAIFNNRNLQD